MKMEQYIRAFAGSFILISLLLSLFSHWWLLLTVFVGVNLLQSAFTGFCPLENILTKFGITKE
ncbi:MAG: DUF2892 domain-containing protein [Proteobacteria bacterium]|nr:DUF2892 domain-containing protein [Pseudomonadota bacterium]